MSETTEAAIERLAESFPQLRPVVTEHVDFFEEMLSHLVMSDIIRWMAAHLESDPDVCRAILKHLETEFQQGPDEVRNLIAVSGVEMIPDPGQPGSGLRDMLGPDLAAMDPWAS